MRRTYYAFAFVCCICISPLYSTHHGDKGKSKKIHLVNKVAEKKDLEPAQKPQDVLCKIIKSSFSNYDGLILHTSTIPICAPFANYNPSVVQFEDGYLMSFRHDIPDPNTRTEAQRRSLTGLIRLDASFNPVGQPTYLELQGRYRDCEDTRLFFVGERLYICCCVYFPEQKATTISLMEIDKQTLEVRQITDLDYANSQKIEKNWTPLVYSPALGKTDLYFMYSFDPHTVLKTRLDFSGKVASKTIPLTPSSAPKPVRRWASKWGFISGGTPAIQVEEGYLTFFHSHFIAQKQVWYVMGAALLEGRPPFRLIKISHQPILFKQMFASPHHSDPRFRLSATTHVVFPSGLAEGTFKGKEVFHVFYGDNDSAAGVVTFDKEKLLKSLHTVK